MATLGSPIESVPKISKRIVPALKKLGIKTIRDLLFYLPSRYEDFSNRMDIKNAVVGQVATLSGTVKKIDAIRTARKKMIIVHALVEDETGKIRATWFNQPYLARTIKPGDRLSLSGKIAVGPQGKYLQNPAYEKLLVRLNLTNYRGSTSLYTSLHTGGLIPVYPETRGITSRWLRFLIKNFIELRKGLADPLPLTTRRKYQLPEIKDAILAIHSPKNSEDAQRAKKRFEFQELLLIQLQALQSRLSLRQHQAPVIPLNVALIKSFVASLPYDLTNAQRRSIWEILQDIAKPRPMNRMLQGDVGSGKTIVAAAVSLLTVRAGFKTAFMAPTEILARQHYETLKKFLAPFEVKIGLMIGAEKVDTNADVVVGTHALIQKHVKFEKLGLVVVDEQHRFGVEQRAKLVTSNQPDPLPSAQKMLPHFLSMSATPIPRTLALTIYGDLDLSILDEMPKFRKEVITKIVEPGRRKEAYEFIRSEVKKGRQAFVICPRIEITNHKSQITNNIQAPNSKNEQQKLLLSEIKAVKEEYKKLSEEIFPDLKVAMLHGKLKSKEKDAVMKKFKNREYDILVSTSVIEVGVDVPNATIMMIEGAERFGLAQLHQFRGRVGRGVAQSYCFLFTTQDGIITKRLKALVQARSGFELAEKDLEIRGPGDVLGTRQSGISALALSALADPRMVREVRREAADILNKDPNLQTFPALKEYLAGKKMIHRE